MLAFYALFLLVQLSNCRHSLPAVRVPRYDMFLFTQAWTPTSCYEWEEKSPSHRCNLPPAEEWSIHGLWPNRNGTIGPFFCDHQLRFNLSALDALRPQLELKWIDVHEGAKPHEFWRHEWEKHGTCCVDLESTSNERKYFQRGLDLHDQYDMKLVLAKAEIVPNEGYLMHEYLDAVEKVLGKKAIVECVTNSKRKETYVSDLRLCFDRQFQLIDCYGIPHYPGNCDRKAKIIYPGSTPPTVIQV